MNGRDIENPASPLDHSILEKLEFMQVASGGKCMEVIKKAAHMAGEIMVDNA